MNTMITDTMELLNEVIEFHIRLNEITKNKQSNDVLLNGGIISRLVYDLDLYVLMRLCCDSPPRYYQNYRHKILIPDPIQDSSGFIFPSIVTDLYQHGICLIWTNSRAYGHRHSSNYDAKGMLLPAFASSDGTLIWYYNNAMHNTQLDENGLTMPAMISPDAKVWYKRGQLHNDNLDPDGSGNTLPAVICPDYKKWCINGYLHNDRKDQYGKTFPAEIRLDGSMLWRNNGLRHNSDKDEHGRQLPAEIYADGIRRWYIDNALHNLSLDDDGNLMPAAIELNGRVGYYVNGIKLKDNRNPFLNSKVLRNGTIIVAGEYIYRD
jgi:hypothetical protein